MGDIQPPLKFCHGSSLQQHATVRWEANTAARCPELFLAFAAASSSPHLGHALFLPSPSWTLVCLTPNCLDLVYNTNCPYFSPCFSHYGLTIFLTQFLLWSFPVQTLSTRSNLILTITVSQFNSTLWFSHEGLDTNAEHVGDIRALSPIASTGDSVPDCLGGLISEALVGIKDL